MWEAGHTTAPVSSNRLQTEANLEWLKSTRLGLLVIFGLFLPDYLLLLFFRLSNRVFLLDLECFGARSGILPTRQVISEAVRAPTPFGGPCVDIDTFFVLEPVDDWLVCWCLLDAGLVETLAW